MINDWHEAHHQTPTTTAHKNKSEKKIIRLFRCVQSNEKVKQTLNKHRKNFFSYVVDWNYSNYKVFSFALLGSAQEKENKSSHYSSSQFEIYILIRVHKLARMF
jgi:hypothetical protein